MTDVKVMALPYAGTCACGTRILRGERAAYDRFARAVLCLSCLGQAESSTLPSMPTAPSPVARAAWRRDDARRPATGVAARAGRHEMCRALPLLLSSQGRRTVYDRMVSALGRRRVAKALLGRSKAGAGYVLNERGIPGRRATISHLFVGAAGIYVIDAKFSKNAEVSVEHRGGPFGPRVETLRVKGRKRGALVTAMHSQRDVLAMTLVGTRLEGSPVIPVLCFVDGKLPVREKNRQVDGVLLCDLKSLVQLVSTDGEWDDGRRQQVADHLDDLLPSTAMRAST